MINNYNNWKIKFLKIIYIDDKIRKLKKWTKLFNTQLSNKEYEDFLEYSNLINFNKTYYKKFLDDRQKEINRKFKIESEKINEKS